MLCFCSSFSIAVFVIEPWTMLPFDFNEKLNIKASISVLTSFALAIISFSLSSSFVFILSRLAIVCLLTGWA